jgi:hypothetical protein
MWELEAQYKRNTAPGERTTVAVDMRSNDGRREAILLS